MANALQESFKQAVLSAWLSGKTIKAVLIDLADYTYSSAHDNLDDIPAGARVATATLASITSTNGVFDTANFTFTAVTGDPCEALFVYYDSGVEGTSTLIAFYDTGVTGLPVTPNGGDIDVTVDASGWFAL